MREIKIGIIGIGPWGLAVFERLVASILENLNVKVRLHLFDTNSFGSGIHNSNLPKDFLLNTVAGQIDSFASNYRNANKIDDAFSFLDWAHKYIDNQLPSDAFLPRSLFGSYQHYVCEILKKKLPNCVDLHEHPTEVIDFEICANETIRILDSLNNTYDVDHVFVCIGHGKFMNSQKHLRDGTLPPYPMDGVFQNIKKNHVVGMKGMGLVAVDVVSNLMQFFGGQFQKKENDELTYVPSGKEPTIYCFSRTGMPFSCRPRNLIGAKNLPKPLFCLKENLPAKGTLNLETHLLPLVCSEMLAAYLLRHVALNEGLNSAQKLRSSLIGKTVSEIKNSFDNIVGENSMVFDPQNLHLPHHASSRQTWQECPSSANASQANSHQVAD